MSGTCFSLGDAPVIIAPHVAMEADFHHGNLLCKKEKRPLEERPE